MADFKLEAAAILGGLDTRIGDNRIVERDDLALVSVATPLGGDEALTAALQSGWSLAMPAPTLTETAGDLRAIRSAPDQIMLMFPHDGPTANQSVQAKLDGAGYTTDQTDVWIVLEVSGPDTLAAMARICPIDLDQSRFAIGASARTTMEHLGAMIIRQGDDSFLLLSASSSAASFLHAVETSYRNVT